MRKLILMLLVVAFPTLGMAGAQDFVTCDGTNIVFPRCGSTVSMAQVTMAVTNLNEVLSITEVSAVYTALTTDAIIICNSGVDFTLYLGAVAANENRYYRIKNVNTNTVTVDGSGAETIDGAATYALDAQYENLTLICNGTAWYIF